MNQLSVIGYVSEEVFRQGHDTTRLEGIERVGWMLNAWSAALRSSHSRKPTMDDAIVLGQMVEPIMNIYGLRDCGVRVGSRSCPSPDRVLPLLTALFDQQHALEPIEFYKEFELIHPFVDGNGRTGKILLNWLNGTLLHPIFPPVDLFGSAISNP